MANKLGDFCCQIIPVLEFAKTDPLVRSASKFPFLIAGQCQKNKSNAAGTKPKSGKKIIPNVKNAKGCGIWPIGIEYVSKREMNTGLKGVAVWTAQNADLQT